MEVAALAILISAFVGGEVVALAVLISAFVGGFLIAGRWVNHPALQVLLGIVMGFVIVGALAVTALGVAFAGCLLMGASPNFR
jgi:hypothetical protein